MDYCGSKVFSFRLKKIFWIATILFAVVMPFGIAVAGPNPLNNLEAGHWLEVPNSSLRKSVNPCPNYYCPPGNTGLGAIMSAWSGGAFDAGRDRLLVWGGGHQDYSGNELYAFELTSLRWERLSNPSTNVSGESKTLLYSDGKPRAVHTHNYIEYVPTMDRFISFGAVGPYPGVGEYSRVFSFLFSDTPSSSGEWGSWDVGSIPDVPVGGGARGACSVYDKKNKVVWVLYRGRLHRFDADPDSPTYNSWTSHVKVSFPLYTTTAIDTDRRLLVNVGNSNEVTIFDLNNPDKNPVVKFNSPLTSNGPGFVFDEKLKKFVGWKGGSDLYVLDPDTWDWTKMPAKSGAPSSPRKAGTYGRFRYSPRYNAYVLANSVDGNVYLYRISDGAGVPLDSLVPRSPTKFQSN